MVEQARAKQLYDHLAVGDILSFLKFAPPRSFDLVLAADVLVYVNDPMPVFAAVARVLAPDGLLAFTTETHEGEDVTLLPTLRFAHAEAYLRDALHSAGLSVLSLAAVTVRSEKGIPVDSLVVIAQTSTPADRVATSAR
jgi:predicted TPR repeat methyltransferase